MNLIEAAFQTITREVADRYQDPNALRVASAEVLRIAKDTQEPGYALVAKLYSRQLWRLTGDDSTKKVYEEVERFADMLINKDPLAHSFGQDLINTLQ